LANMIFGLFKTAMNRTGHRLALGMPESIHAKHDAVTKLEKNEKLIWPFLADGQPCQIIIAQDR